MRLVDHRVEIGERAEHRIDPAVIGDVIAEIAHRRGEEGREPDRVGAERRNMIEMRGNARQVADPIAVRVRIAARVDLVDHRAAPPVAIQLRLGHARRLAHLAPPVAAQAT